MHAQRAIVLFVRDEVREALLKPLPGRYRRFGYGTVNRRIAERCRPLLGVDTDLVIVSDGGAGPSDTRMLRQRGTTFGERITNAFADLFARGYRQVVMVGNDCPSLSHRDIAEAFNRLEQGARYAAAPARDGGAFLVAARADGFSSDSFLQLPWQTPALLAAFSGLPKTAVLPVVREDYDDWSAAGAVRALAPLLHGTPSPAWSGSVRRAPLGSRARIKAIMRPFLPAPPPFST